MVFFVGVGYAADQWWGTDPWGVLVGAALGMVSMIAQLVRLTGELSGPPEGDAPPASEGSAERTEHSRDADRDEE